MHRIFRQIFFIIAVLVFQQVAAQSFALEKFIATPDGSDILVSWEVNDISGVSSFKLFRKVGTEPSYTELTTIIPDASVSYSFLDYTIYKDQSQTIYYQLKVSRYGTEYTFTTSIIHNPTSVQRTWGSIKAMFR